MKMSVYADATEEITTCVRHAMLQVASTSDGHDDDHDDDDDFCLT